MSARQVVFELEGFGTVKGWVQSIDGAIWAHVDSQTFVIEPQRKSRRGRATASGASPGNVLSPMPGKIVRVHAVEGSRVEAGGILIALEAMKMEYALKAQASGVVRSIKCKLGEQVELGQSLVEIEIDSPSRG